jgi:uncharacterized membrane protein
MTSFTPPISVKHRARTERGRWSWAWVALSSVSIAGYFVGQYAQGTLDTMAGNHVGLAPVYAARMWPVQVAFYLHIVSGGLALVLGPLQFSHRLRNRHWRAHRVIGRTYMITVGVGAISAFVMSMFNSVGILGFFGFGSLAVLWGWTAWRAYRAIRQRDVRNHQVWVIRNFALTYAAVTLRLWFGVLILVQIPFVHGDNPFVQILAQAYAPLPFLCWLPNVVIAEIMIKRRGLPGLRFTPLTAPQQPGQAYVPAGSSGR